MLVWFHQWRQEHGSWLSLPVCDFQVRAMAIATIETRVISATTEIKMTLGEMQALRVLTTLHYLAEVGPKSPPAGQIAQSVQLIMWPLQQAETFHLCLMLCWDMLYQLDQEVPQSRLTYHVLIYLHYPPVWVQLGTCLNLTIDLDLGTTSPPWEK